MLRDDPNLNATRTTLPQRLPLLVFVAALGACETEAAMPIISTSPGVTVRADDSSYACEESAPAIESYLAYLDDVFGAYRPVVLPHVEVRVHGVQSEMPRECGSASACVTDGRIVHAVRTAWHPHEFVHVVAGAFGRAPSLFEEGLAIYAEPAEDLGATVNRSTPIESYVESSDWVELHTIDAATSLDVARAMAAFTGFLIRNVGLATYLEFYDGLTFASSFSTTSNALHELTGLDLGGWISSWRASPVVSDSMLLGLDEPYGCARDSLPAIATIALSCGVQPISQLGSSFGSYARVQLDSPGRVAVRYAPALAASALLVDGCGTDPFVHQASEFDSLETVHILQLAAGAFSFSVEAAPDPGGQGVSVESEPLDLLDGCSTALLPIAAPTNAVASSPQVFTEHPVVGASATYAFSVTSSSSLEFDVDVEPGVWVCTGDCRDVTKCALASTALSGGPMTIPSGDSVYVVVEESNTSADLGVRFR